MSGYLPNLRIIPQDIKMVQEFKGYNHNPVIGDGEFYNQQNISADSYPLLTCRQRRTLSAKMLGDVVTIGAADHMAWITNGMFCYNGQEKFPVDSGRTDGTQLVRMGAYICVFPQGTVYNTQDDTWENIRIINESKKPADGSTNISVQVVYPVVNAKGETEWETPAGSWTESDDDPYTETTKDGDWWLKTSVRPPVLYRWSESHQMWISVTNAYLAIAAGSIGSGLKVGDGITISGIEDYNGVTFSHLNGTYTVEGFWMGGNYIVLNVPYLPALNMIMGWTIGDVVVERKLPQMDYVCEMGNRLYGCSTENHEIYASKLGDPLNWNVFQGVSTDSYAATVGSPGAFTGCIGYRNSVMFFKEDCIHILTGTRPATYQIDTLECNGVQMESSKSLCIVNETLYFKGVDGFYAYSGGLPQYVSNDIGQEQNRFNVWAAGTDGTKYYAALGIGDANATTSVDIFVYDPRRGVWCREDSHALVLDFASIGTSLYFLSTDFEFSYIWRVSGQGDNNIGNMWETGELEGVIEWSATSGLIGLDSPFGKYISQIRLRGQVDRGSVFTVLIDYDESGKFHEVGRISGERLRSFNLTIATNRCDTMRIKFAGRTAHYETSGERGFKLFSISYVTEQGGDI